MYLLFISFNLRSQIPYSGNLSLEGKKFGEYTIFEHLAKKFGRLTDQSEDY